MPADRPGRPFDDLRRVLGPAPSQASLDDETDIRPDATRQRRTGSPEIVYAAGKTPAQVAAAVRVLVERSGRALASRCDAGAFTAIAGLSAGGWSVELDEGARMAVVARPDAAPPTPYGQIAILAAGTSDLAVAGEIELVAREIGCETRLVADVGVAGLHRLVRPLETIIDEGADAIVVVAGMDGALPSVVAGLVSVPVIGVPTSTGYGFGGDGTGALMAMLQSCAPGLTVVNIDNGVGAAIAAGRIARRRTTTTD